MNTKLRRPSVSSAGERLESKSSRGPIQRANMLPTLTIRLDRLPDLCSDEAAQAQGFLDYGRFAVTNSGRFWLGPARSSHPSDTRVGWYWALEVDGTLLVSPRGAGIEGLALFNEGKPILALLVKRLVDIRAIKRPRRISLEKMRYGS